MRGHIRKRGQTWTIVYDHGPDPVTGRRRQRWRGGFRTRKEAERELARALHEMNQGGDPFPDTLLLRAFVERWLEHQRTRIRPRTFERYSQQMRDHVLPEIGNVPLTKLRPVHVQRVLDAMASKGFGPRSIVQARSILGAALRQAVAWGITTTNPVSAVKPPKPDRPQLAVPLRHDLLRVLVVAEGSVWEIPILLAIATGARRAEVLGLCWDAVDLERGRIRIVRGIQRTPGGGGLRFVEPKTDRGRREVALPAFAIVRLKEHRRRQAASRLAQGPQWLDLGIVCDRGDGGPLDPNAFSRAFKRLALAAGFPSQTRLHDLRHAFATLLLEEGMHPAVTSAVLGHSSPAFTMSVYQHILDGMGQAAADALERALQDDTDEDMDDGEADTAR